MNRNEELASWIEQAAAKVGSQAKLAKRLGVTPAAICNWKTGINDPNTTNLVTILKLIGKLSCAIVVAVSLITPQEAGASSTSTRPGAEADFTIKELSNYTLRNYLKMLLGKVWAAFSGFRLRPMTGTAIGGSLA